MMHLSLWFRKWLTFQVNLTSKMCFEIIFLFYGIVLESKNMWFSFYFNLLHHQKNTLFVIYLFWLRSHTFLFIWFVINLLGKICFVLKIPACLHYTVKTYFLIKGTYIFFCTKDPPSYVAAKCMLSLRSLLF